MLGWPAAREITSAAMPSDTHASTIMSSLARRLTAEISVGQKAVAVQKASDRQSTNRGTQAAGQIPLRQTRARRERRGCPGRA
jgi:hypothetical protein